MLINGVTIVQFLNPERDAGQRDPTSAYIAILTLDILFHIIEKHPEIKSIEIFEYCSLYTPFKQRFF